MTQIDDSHLPYHVYFGWRVAEHLVAKQRAMSNSVIQMHLGKYNWLPIFFFKQFKKLVNIYFIVITLLAFVPGSPKHPALSAVTLCVLMLFQAMKDANEVFKI